MAVPNQSAVTCANKLLNEVISRFGCPLTLHSDRGRNYESSIFTELCKLLEIKKTRTSVRNPRCNGQAERFNRSLLRMIKAYVRGEQENWGLNLGCLAAAYRACPHVSTGLSSNLLMLVGKFAYLQHWFTVANVTITERDPQLWRICTAIKGKNATCTCDCAETLEH